MSHGTEVQEQSWAFQSRMVSEDGDPGESLPSSVPFSVCATPPAQRGKSPEMGMFCFHHVLPITVFSWFLPDLVYSSTLNTACLFCLQAPIRVLLPRGTPARQVLACLQEKTHILLPPWSLL